MAIEFLLVTFPEQRSVLADGAGVGFTNHILMLPGDEYEITIDGSGYVPASQVIALAGTSMVKPLVIGFAPALAVAKTARGLPLPDAADVEAPVTAMATTRGSSTRPGAKKSAKKSAKKRAKTGAKTLAVNTKSAKLKPGRKA